MNIVEELTYKKLKILKDLGSYGKTKYISIAECPVCKAPVQYEQRIDSTSSTRCESCNYSQMIELDKQNSRYIYKEYIPKVN